LDAFQEGILSELDAARTVANNLAQKLLTTVDKSGRKLTTQDALKVLRKWAFRKNEARLNVMPEGSTYVHSDTLGLIRARDGRYMNTEATVLYPDFFKLLNRWLQDQRPKEYTEPFPFTSISVNYDYGARIHRDQGNHGPSMGVAMGNFKGGRLNYWELDNKQLHLDDLLDKTPKIVDVAKGPKLFDGRRAHSVEAFKGERYSLVFFSAGKYWKAKPKEQEFLRSKSVEFPTPKSVAYYEKRLPKATGYGSEKAGSRRVQAVDEPAPKRRKVR